MEKCSLLENPGQKALELFSRKRKTIYRIRNIKIIMQPIKPIGMECACRTTCNEVNGKLECHTSVTCKEEPFVPVVQLPPVKTLRPRFKR